MGGEGKAISAWEGKADLPAEFGVTKGVRKSQKTFGEVMSLENSAAE